MSAYRRRSAKEFTRNPFTIFLLSLLACILLTYISKAYDAEIGKVWAETISAVAAAILTSGTFGLWFDVFGKERLIEEVVRDTVGQSKSLVLGISDIEPKVTDIDEKQTFRLSTELVIGSRRSARLLERYRDDIRERLLSGRNMSIICMDDANMYPSSSGYNVTPMDFARSIQRSDRSLAKLIAIYHTKEPMSYNFVMSDGGIWIKLYFNAPQPELPPAFFVREGSPLYGQFRADILKLVAAAQQVHP